MQSPVPGPGPQAQADKVCLRGVHSLMVAANMPNEIDNQCDWGWDTGKHGGYESPVKGTSSSLWRRRWHPTPVLLPGDSHGWRSLVGCSPWGREESDTAERLHFHFSLSCTGEGNGNPLQCSCLENPRDGGAWWAAVYGVAQSQT